MQPLFGHMKFRSKCPETCRAPGRRQKGDRSATTGCMCLCQPRFPRPAPERGTRQPPGNSPRSPRLSSSPLHPNFSQTPGDRSGRAGAASAVPRGVCRGGIWSQRPRRGMDPFFRGGGDDTQTLQTRARKSRESLSGRERCLLAEWIPPPPPHMFFPTLCARRCSHPRRRPPRHGPVPPAPTRAVAGKETINHVWHRPGEAATTAAAAASPVGCRVPAPSRVGPGAPVCGPAATPAGGALVTGTAVAAVALRPAGPLRSARPRPGPAPARRRPGGNGTGQPRGRGNDRQRRILLSLGGGKQKILQKKESAKYTSRSGSQVDN